MNWFMYRNKSIDTHWKKKKRKQIFGFFFFWKKVNLPAIKVNIDTATDVPKLDQNMSME